MMRAAMRGLSLRLALLTLAAASLGGALGLALPIGTRRIVERLAPDGDLVGIGVTALALAAIGGVIAYVNFRGGVWNQALWLDWERRAMRRAFRRLLGAPLTFHRRRAPAESVETLRGAVQAREALASVGLAMASALAVLLASGGYLVWLAPGPGAAALIGLGALSLVAAALMRAQTRARLQAAHREAEETGFLSAALRARQGPGGDHGAASLAERWEAIHARRIGASRRAQAARDGQRALDAAAAGLAPAGLIWLAAMGDPSPGEMAAIYAAFGQCMMAALALSAAAARLSQANEGLAMLDRLPAATAAPPAPAPIRDAPAVWLENLSFAYADGRPVLRGIDLNLERGEALALTGPSGVGKSTLIRVIAGLDAPSDGTVRLFGRDPAQYWGGGRRAAFGVVVLDVPGAAPPAGSAAGRLFEAMIAAGGDPASATAAARAVADGPGLVLVDEAFGGGDAAALDLFFAHLRDIGAAAIVATHDPEIVRRCDRQLALTAPE